MMQELLQNECICSIFKVSMTKIGQLRALQGPFPYIFSRAGVLVAVRARLEQYGKAPAHQDSLLR